MRIPGLVFGDLRHRTCILEAGGLGGKECERRRVSPAPLSMQRLAAGAHCWEQACRHGDGADASRLLSPTRSQTPDLLLFGASARGCGSLMQAIRYGRWQLVLMRKGKVSSTLDDGRPCASGDILARMCPASCSKRNGSAAHLPYQHSTYLLYVARCTCCLAHRSPPARLVIDVQLLCQSAMQWEVI